MLKDTLNPVYSDERLKTKKTIVYKESDYLTVHHFLIYNDKTKSFTFGRGGKGTANLKSLNTMASKYFAKDEIELLIAAELKAFKPALRELYLRYGMKMDKDQKDFGIDQIKDMSKDDVITLLMRMIQENQTDPKIINGLITQLVNLKDWKGTKDDLIQTNIIQYYIPKKQTTI